jgi:hypothetical protein
MNVFKILEVGSVYIILWKPKIITFSVPFHLCVYVYVCDYIYTFNMYKYIPYMCVYISAIVAQDPNKVIKAEQSLYISLVSSPIDTR